MSSDAPSTVPLCPACNAKLLPGEATCWLCDAAVTAGDDAPASTPQSAAPLPPTTLRPATSFSLSTLLMFMTLVAVVCGVFSIAPGVGAVMAIVLLPVLAHTAISARREAAMGYNLGAGDRVMLFFSSLALIAATGIAASIAFGISCTAGFWASTAAGDVLGARGLDSLDWGFYVGATLGTIAAAYVGYKVMIAMSRKPVLGHEGMPSLSRGDKFALAIAVLLAVIGGVAACLHVVSEL
jgi:hypothetical protein